MASKELKKNVSRFSSTLILKEEKLGTKWIFFAKISSNLRSSRFFDIFHYSIKPVYTLHTFSMVLFWNFLWFYNLRLKVLPLATILQPTIGLFHPSPLAFLVVLVLLPEKIKQTADKNVNKSCKYYSSLPVKCKCLSS